MDYYTEINSSLKLRKKIMRRVYITWLLKKLTTPFTIEIMLGIFLMILLILQCSLSNIWHNAPMLSKPFSLIHFFILAFINTELLVKLFMIASVIIFYSLFQKMIKSIVYLLTKKNINFLFQTREIKDI